MNTEQTENWVAWTEFIRVKNIHGIVMIFPTASGKSKRVIMPNDDLPPEVTQETIKKCLYRQLTRHERRSVK